MSTILLRPARAADARYLGPRLRDEDKAEIVAASGEDPTTTLLAGLEDGQAWTGYDIQGRRLGIFGVGKSPHDATLGHPWMLATPALLRHQIAFIRQTRDALSLLKRDFKRLCNLVDARNTVHVKWIQWCGFTLLKPVPYGVEGRDFIPFLMDIT